MADSQPHAFLPPKTKQTIAAKKAFSAGDAPTETSEFDNPKDVLRENVDRIYELQRKLYADNRFSLLLVFQAMDAAGKDSTIRHVLSGVNPAGFQVFSFKQPSSEELEHDFLWRSARRLPERGRIGVFNRSYYEEALVVRVHPEYLGGQNLPDVDPAEIKKKFWEHRFESIRDHEAHLARNGTVVLKFWLNVSQDEQKNRFIDRLRRPEKNWKFSESDLSERAHWDAYMDAYSELLPETSRPWAPWFAIPADSKKRMRAMVSQIVADTLEAMPLAWPTVPEAKAAEYAEILENLERDE
ncbi:MAG: PPK2 family polyphosphate kinase [Myxococcota bacterium]